MAVFVLIAIGLLAFVSADLCERASCDEVFLELSGATCGVESEGVLAGRVVAKGAATLAIGSVVAGGSLTGIIARVGRCRDGSPGTPAIFAGVEKSGLAIGSFRSADGVAARAAMAGLAVPVPCELSVEGLVSRRRSPGFELGVVVGGTSDDERDRRTADSGAFCIDGVKLGGSLGRTPRATGWIAAAGGGVID